MTMQRIQRYEDTAANWASRNLPLPQGWEGVESDTGRYKQGNGSTRWNSLPYTNPSGTAEIFDVRDYGAAVNGTTDDTAAVQLALDAIETNNGGSLYFPDGVTKITGELSIDMNTKAGHVRITGSQGASVLIAGSGANGAFYIANAPLVTVENLTFVGTGATGADTDQAVFWFNVCEVSRVENCRFIGLAITAPEDATYALNKWHGLIVGRQTRLTVSGCLFGGCSTLNCPNIGVDDWFALRVVDTQFADFGYYGSATRTKTGWQDNSYWIRAINAAEPTDSFRGDTLILDNLLMDEGNIQCVFIEDVGSVQLNAVKCNSGKFDISSIHIKDAQRVTVKDCSVHEVNYAVNDNGLAVENCDAVEIDRLLLEGVIVNLNVLGTTKRVVLRNSTGVTIVNTAGAFIDADQAMPATPSAAALAPLGKVTHVTGAVNITSITTTNLRAGDEITLIFDSTPTLTDGNNIKAAGNLVATADDTWTGVYDGTNVVEKCRSVN